MQRGRAKKLATWCALEIQASKPCPKDAAGFPALAYLVAPYGASAWRFSCASDACTAYSLGTDLTSQGDNYSWTVGKNEVQPYVKEENVDCSEFKEFAEQPKVSKPTEP